MAYTPIQTENTLEKVKLSYTTKEVFDVINNNSAEEDTRADRADAKFEAIENKLDTIETDATKVEPSQTNGNIIINGTETPVYRLPQLTPSDVGADPAGTAASAVATHNSDENAHTYIQGLVSTAQQKADDAYALAEGRENATSYTNYQAMVTALNAESTATLKVGDNIYIETVGVPDLWVSDVLDSKASYTYTSDQAIVDALNNPSVGYINIGWYRLDELETAKVDLSDYVPTTTTITGSNGLNGGGSLAENRVIEHDVNVVTGDTIYLPLAIYKTKIDKYGHHIEPTVATAESGVSGSNEVTLVTRGEKYTWNSQSSSISTLSSNKMDKANPTGTGSIAVGSNLVATGTNSQALGLSAEARGDYSSAFGYQVFAYGKGAHAEGGVNTCAFSRYSHAEGAHTIAGESGYNDSERGEGAHAEGVETLAKGTASHAEGYGTIANHQSQHVFGHYNIADTSTELPQSKGNYIEIVGNGTGNSTRSNARTLDWSGNETLAGNIKLGNHTTLANNSNSDITINLPSSAGTLALTTDIPTVTVSKSFTASDSRWSALSNGVYTLTINSATSGDEDVAGKHPFVCYNENNEQVMATLGFTSTTVYVKSDTKFAGTVYMI